MVNELLEEKKELQELVRSLSLTPAISVSPNEQTPVQEEVSAETFFNTPKSE